MGGATVFVQLRKNELSKLEVQDYAGFPDSIATYEKCVKDVYIHRYP